MCDLCEGCETCSGSGRISGRVDHMRFITPRNHGTAGTYAYEAPFYDEGSHIHCPECNREQYGRITKVTKR